MHNNQESMIGLLRCLDHGISMRDRQYKLLDLHYKDKDGQVASNEIDDYISRKSSIEAQFKEKAVDYRIKIDNLCQRIRKSQPSLLELSSSAINERSRFPRNIALGKHRVNYNGKFLFDVPKVFSFPFDKPMYICDDSKVVLLHKVLLRLLFALPIEKQEYYVFDPIGLGKTVSKFNKLLTNDKLFPQKKVLSTTMELKETLKDTIKYILDLQSNVFNIDTDCLDWDSYNRRLYSQGQSRKILPYKVFIFSDVPDGMDQECFDMFKTLIKHGKQCGLLVLFSFNKSILCVENIRMRKMEIDLRECIKDSVQLHNVFDKDEITSNFDNLQLKNIGEKFPSDFELSRMLNGLQSVSKSKNKYEISFLELIQQEQLFNNCSENGLIVPIGCGVSGNSIVKLTIGDDIPHYLIGGATGSGKSNLLHNMIISACSRYSPDELRLYLLDFKEGVEFSQYAKPNLRHAMLVATEADTEYGINVLKHLVNEKEKRYAIFKDHGCKDIQSYRKKNSTAKMPRIMVVIDEFQVLFSNEEKNQTITTLEMLAKQGRACGIHLILATQSIRGIEFNLIGPQFTGRIALKCSVEDSRMLLGGISSNNDEAANIKVPFAILNTNQGNVSGNVKFMVPKAEEEKISEAIQLINFKSDSLNIVNLTKVFEGQKLPSRPDLPPDESRNLTLFLGEMMDYNAELFRLTLKPRVSENLLICGHNDIIKKSLLESIVISIKASSQCEEIIYIGNNIESIKENLRTGIINLYSVKEFCEKYSEEPYDRKRIVLIDNCNLSKEIGYTNLSYPPPKDNALFFKEYIENANEKNSHIIAFYESSNQIKNYGVPKDEFNYRIGYCVSVDEKNSLMGIGSQSNIAVKKNRAFLVDNMQLSAWFRPFI